MEVVYTNKEAPLNRAYEVTINLEKIGILKPNLATIDHKPLILGSQAMLTPSFNFLAYKSKFSL